MKSLTSSPLFFALPSLFILISDPFLREAVVEQIRIATLGDPRLLSDPSVWEESREPDIFVVDDQDFEAFRAVLGKDRSEKPTLLILGGSPDIDGIAEAFPKPFRLGHLIERLRYYLETPPLLKDKEILFGPYRLEPQHRCAFRQGDNAPIRLTEKETSLLVHLSRTKTVASKRDILASVWGYDDRIDTHTLETHIYQLRRKFDREGENWLIGEAGGYRLAGSVG